MGIHLKWDETMNATRADDSIVITVIKSACVTLTWAPSQYEDRLSQEWVSHVKDKTVDETVLSLTWESLYW